jgi:hypothetical protein
LKELKELKELKPGICVSSAVESMEYVPIWKENFNRPKRAFGIKEFDTCRAAY